MGGDWLFNKLLEDFKRDHMTPDEITEIVRYTLVIATEMSAPILLVTLMLGLTISIFQSVTQISETTLIFIPKIFTFAITFGIFFPWMLKVMTKFTYDILIDQWDKLMLWSNYAM